jgi:penicillin-insensitive murein DD-endopeptidase
LTPLAAALVILVAATPPRGPLESKSFGTTSRGRLENGVSLPIKGTGFVTYSRAGNALGRQYVHSRVRDTLIAAFAAQHAAHAERTFVVGETGLQHGGRFWPHRSHQNGMSVDIFMPVRDAQGRWTRMPTPSWQQFGYAHEFDAKGQEHGLTIDFGCLADLLVELDRQAGRHGLALERIIVAPEYVDRVLDAGGAEARDLEPRLMRRPSWVRHDEHVHLDFRVVDA